MSSLYNEDELKQMSRKDLQGLAKKHGIKGNQKTEVIRSSLQNLKKEEKSDQKEKEAKQKAAKEDENKDEEEGEGAASKEPEPIHTQREEPATDESTKDLGEGPQILVQETINEVMIGDRTVLREVTIEEVILKRKEDEAPSDEPPAKFARIEQEEDDTNVVT